MELCVNMSMNEFADKVMSVVKKHHSKNIFNIFKEPRMRIEDSHDLYENSSISKFDIEKKVRDDQWNSIKAYKNKMTPDCLSRFVRSFVLKELKILSTWYSYEMTLGFKPKYYDKDVLGKMIEYAFKDNRISEKEAEDIIEAVDVIKNSSASYEKKFELISCITINILSKSRAVKFNRQHNDFKERIEFSKSLKENKEIIDTWTEKENKRIEEMTKSVVGGIL